MPSQESDRSEAATAHSRDAGALGLNAAAGVGIVQKADEIVLALPDLQRDGALTGLRKQLVGIESMTDLGLEPEALESAASTTASRPRSPRLRRRVSIAAERLDAQGRLESEQQRPASDRRSPDPHSRLEPDSAAESVAGVVRSRYAPTERPAAVVDVMSLAEWTATSTLRARASSSSFTKTPRAPISPNGLVRSRSPAVVIGTSAISRSGLAARKASSAVAAACVSASRPRGSRV